MTTKFEGTGSSVTSPKYLINCGDKITDTNPTTSIWLNNLQALTTISENKSSQMTHKRILEGILEENKNVVVKVSDKHENLEKEFNIYKLLLDNNIKGIVHYYCYFECEDSLERFKYGKQYESICNGKGNTLRVLVMEYIKNKSFAEYNWKKIDRNAIISIIKQSLLTYLDAFMKFGFIHGDFHCNNILIKKTTSKKPLIYTINGKEYIIEIYGYKAKLMDFELSKTNGTVREFYSNITYAFFGSLNTYIIQYFDNETSFINFRVQLRKLMESESDALELISLINTL